jgi:hypothetical protein
LRSRIGRGVHPDMMGVVEGRGISTLKGVK